MEDWLRSGWPEECNSDSRALASAPGWLRCPCTEIGRMGARKEFVRKSRFQSAKSEMQKEGFRCECSRGRSSGTEAIKDLT